MKKQKPSKLSPANTLASPQKNSSLRRKLFIIFFAVLFLLVVAGSSYVIYRLLVPQLSVSQQTQTPMPDGSIYGMCKITLTDYNMREPNVELEMYMIFPIESKDGRLLQTADKGNYFLHSINSETGIVIRMNQQFNTSFYVNQDQFADFVTKKISQEGIDANKQIPISEEQFLSELGQIFKKSIENQTKSEKVEVKFINTTMANLKINPASKQMQFDLKQTGKRKLFESHLRNLGFFSSILSFAGKIVPKVAGFVVNTVRKYGPMIGKVAGGVIGGVGGFITGGPAGAFQGAMTGMQIGEAIGSAASSLVNACIPQGTLRISCSPNSIGSVISQFGGSMFGNMGMFPGMGGGGGKGGMMGNIMSSIPSNALSFFGLGSLFSS